MLAGDGEQQVAACPFWCRASSWGGAVEEQGVLRSGCQSGAAWPCMLHKAYLSFYFSFTLLLCPLPQHTQNTLTCAAPLQLTAWYPETWTLGWATQGKHQCYKKKIEEEEEEKDKNLDQFMHCHITPTKTLALNSCCCCCSLKCNAFTLCIHTRAGCLGDTQNGRTYVTKCWRNEESTDERGEMNCHSGVCEEGREHKKSKWQMSEKRRDTATVQTTTARAECVKGHKTYTKKNTRTHTLPTCIVSGS